MKEDTLEIDLSPRSNEPGELSIRVFGEGLFAIHRLPRQGRVVVGRAPPQGGIVVEHRSISRQHLALHVEGERVEVEDLESRNGTSVGGHALRAHERVAVDEENVVQIGTVLLFVQRASKSERPRRIATHGHFEMRLEEECARASRRSSTFGVMRIRAESGKDEQIVRKLSSIVRPSDVLACYAPRDYELLLPDSDGKSAHAIAKRVDEALRGERGRCTIAIYPTDGRTADQLVATLSGNAATPSKQSASDLVMEDPATKKILALVDRIAPSKIPVLILGETGVGKEVFAELVHRGSPRANAPYVRVNCAAFSETLLESELFGHERGAFTGAHQQKRGLLEEANGGTMFLDEVGDLPAGLQSKLLRILEEGELRRVGGVKSIAIDVRFVAATNRDLEADVARGAFRKDLFFRLNGASLWIPPLRDRPADVVPLATFFLERASRDLGRAPATLSDEGIAALTTYAWPGNIRELRNAMERAALLPDDGVVRREHLPLDKMSVTVLRDTRRHPAVLLLPDAIDSDDRAPESAMRVPSVAPATEEIAPTSVTGEFVAARHLRSDLDDLEHRRILDALDRFAGNQTRAAQFLGMRRATFVARLDKYGIPRPRK